LPSLLKTDVMNEYKPQPLDTSYVSLPQELVDLSEMIARNVHEVWSKGRIDDGWTYGAERNDEAKNHPCLLPYDKLPESEKEYDRRTSQETLKMIIALGFRIVK